MKVFFKSSLAKLEDALNLIRTSQTLFLGVIAIFIGFAGGAGVWLFKLLIDAIHKFMFDIIGGWMHSLGSWSLILIPAIGGVIVGLISMYLIKNETLHGTAAIMQSVALSGGRLPYQSAPIKTAAAIISIGSGASVGPEDPSVQIGANIGSMIGQVLRLSDERIQTLVAAGGASAIAAAFNAPIAGVFFALEIILGEISGDALGLILISSVISSVFTQAVSGNAPAFQVPAYDFKSIWELPLYLVLGLFAGPLSAMYVSLLYKLQDIYHAWKIQVWVKTASAGLILGITSLFVPQVLGTGYSTIDQILNKNNFTLWFLIVLVLSKLLLTPVSIGGGFKGGVFAPALFTGAALGGAFGLGAAYLFPSLGIDPRAFALVGMAAVLAGAVHAPLTAVILLFEMTNDYHIILPLMFAVAVSLTISKRISRDSVYAMGLARHGIRLNRGRDIEVLDSVTVEDAMQKDTTALQESDLLSKAADLMLKKHHHGLPVLNSRGELVGILALQDIERAGDQNMKVGAVCTRDMLTAFPDETLAAALRRMSEHDIGRLPVISREDKRKLVGILRRADVIHAYDIALTRRTMERHHEGSIRLDTITPDRVDITDARVESGAPIAMRKMKEIPFPAECVIASVRRGRKVFIPRGDTVIHPGDILVIVAQGKSREAAIRLCRAE